MKTAFIITSAIRFKGSSVVDQLIRLQQTIHTIESIRLRVDDADIFLVETGSVSLDESMISMFPKNVEIIKLNNHPRINEIQQESIIVSDRISPRYSSADKTQEEIKNFIKIGYVKSITEQFAIGVLLNSIDFSNYDTVFKISGRYFLNDKFNLDSHNTNGISARYLSEKEDSINTSLWSFTGSIYSEIKEQWPELLEKMMSKFNSNENTDIEQCMFLTFLERDQLIKHSSIKILGVSGIVNNPFGKILLNQ